MSNSPLDIAEQAYWQGHGDALADLRTEVEADRKDIAAKILLARDAMEFDTEQIDQWASERVALNRVLALIDEATHD